MPHKKRFFTTLHTTQKNDGVPLRTMIRGIRESSQRKRQISFTFRSCSVWTVASSVGQKTTKSK